MKLSQFCLVGVLLLLAADISFGGKEEARFFIAMVIMVAAQFICAAIEEQKP